MSHSFNPTQADQLLSTLERIATALENLDNTGRSLDVNVDAMEAVISNLNDLGYLHGIAKQIDELKEVVSIIEERM